MRNLIHRIRHLDYDTRVEEMRKELQAHGMEMPTNWERIVKRMNDRYTIKRMNELKAARERKAREKREWNKQKDHHIESESIVRGGEPDAHHGKAHSARLAQGKKRRSKDDVAPAEPDIFIDHSSDGERVPSAQDVDVSNPAPHQEKGKKLTPYFKRTLGIQNLLASDEQEGFTLRRNRMNEKRGLKITKTAAEYEKRKVSKTELRQQVRRMANAGKLSPQSRDRFEQNQKYSIGAGATLLDLDAVKGNASRARVLDSIRRKVRSAETDEEKTKLIQEAHVNFGLAPVTTEQVKNILERSKYNVQIVASKEAKAKQDRASTSTSLNAPINLMPRSFERKVEEDEKLIRRMLPDLNAKTGIEFHSEATNDYSRDARYHHEKIKSNERQKAPQTSMGTSFEQSSLPSSLSTSVASTVSRPFDVITEKSESARQKIKIDYKKISRLGQKNQLDSERQQLYNLRKQITAEAKAKKLAWQKANPDKANDSKAWNKHRIACSKKKVFLLKSGQMTEEEKKEYERNKQLFALHKPRQVKVYEQLRTNGVMASISKDLALIEDDEKRVEFVLQAHEKAGYLGITRAQAKKKAYNAKRYVKIKQARQGNVNEIHLASASSAKRKSGSTETLSSSPPPEQVRHGENDTDPTSSTGVILQRRTFKPMFNLNEPPISPSESQDLLLPAVDLTNDVPASFGHTRDNAESQSDPNGSHLAGLNQVAARPSSSSSTWSKGKKIVFRDLKDEMEYKEQRRRQNRKNDRGRAKKLDANEQIPFDTRSAIIKQGLALRRERLEKARLEKGEEGMKLEAIEIDKEKSRIANKRRRDFKRGSMTVEEAELYRNNQQLFGKGKGVVPKESDYKPSLSDKDLTGRRISLQVMEMIRKEFHTLADKREQAELIKKTYLKLNLVPPDDKKLKRKVQLENSNFTRRQKEKLWKEDCQKQEGKSRLEKTNNSKDLISTFP